MYEVTLIRPCTDRPNLFIAEAKLPRELDMSRVEPVLGGFADVRYSQRLGVAKFCFDGREVIVYRNGRVDLRQVRDADDARRAMRRLEELLGDCFI